MVILLRVRRYYKYYTSRQEQTKHEVGGSTSTHFFGSRSEPSLAVNISYFQTCGE